MDQPGQPIDEASALALQWSNFSAGVLVQRILTTLAWNNTETEIFCGLSQSCWNISDGESLRIILMLTLFVGKTTASRRASTMSHHEIYGPAVPLDLECLPWHPWNANEHLFERMQALLPHLFFKLLTIPSVELLSNATQFNQNL